MLVTWNHKKVWPGYLLIANTENRIFKCKKVNLATVVKGTLDIYLIMISVKQGDVKHLFFFFFFFKSLAIGQRCSQWAGF